MRNLIVRVSEEIKKGYTLEAVGYTVTVKYGKNELGAYRKRGQKWIATDRNDDEFTFDTEDEAFLHIKNAKKYRKLAIAEEEIAA